MNPWRGGARSKAAPSVGLELKALELRDAAHDVLAVRAGEGERGRDLQPL